MPQETPTGKLAFRIMKAAVLAIQAVSLILFVVFAILSYNIVTGHPNLPIYALVPFGFGSIVFLFAFLVGVRVSSEIHRAEEDTKDKSE